MATILIMDKDIQQANLLADLLEQNDHLPVVTHNVYDAIERFTHDNIDILIIDISKPLDDRAHQQGIRLLNSIRKEEQETLDYLPIVTISKPKQRPCNQEFHLKTSHCKTSSLKGVSKQTSCYLPDLDLQHPIKLDDFEDHIHSLLSKKVPQARAEFISMQDTHEIRV